MSFNPIPLSPRLRYLLLIEDSRDLCEGVSRLAARLQWEVLIASSLKQAESLLSSNPPPIHAALIDLMFPETNEALNKVVDLLDRRNKESTILTKTRRLTEDFERQRDALDAIDREIERLIADNAGLTFMQSAHGRKALDGIPVAIFTSRGEEEEGEGGSMGLFAEVVAALGREPDRWWEKPVDSAEIDEWLRTI